MNPSVRIYTKADENFSLSGRDGSAVLVPANPKDKYQHWIKDMRHSSKVMKNEHFSSFALINKVTGEALTYCLEAHNPFQLIPYDPDYLDTSILWSESKESGAGFCCIRTLWTASKGLCFGSGSKGRVSPAEESDSVCSSVPLVLPDYTEIPHPEKELRLCEFSEFDESKVALK